MPLADKWNGQPSIAGAHRSTIDYYAFHLSANRKCIKQNTYNVSYVSFAILLYYFNYIMSIILNFSQKNFILNLGKKFVKLGILFYKKCLKILKNTRKRSFSGENIKLNGTMRQKIVKKLKFLRLFKYDRNP